MCRPSLHEIRDEDGDYDEKEDPAEILSQLFEFADKACNGGRERADTLSAWLNRKPIAPYQPSLDT